MIVGVDAGCLGIKDKRLNVGIYQVAYHLFKELKKIDKRNTYILYSFYPIEKKLMRTFPKHCINKVLPRIGWFRLWLPLQIFFDKPQIFLALSQAMPWYHPFKTVGFVHALDLFSKFHKERNAKMKKNTKFLLKHAEILVTTSIFLKEEIQKKYKKISHVIPLGVDSLFFNKGKPHTENSPYFLFVGSLKASKNISTALKAFEQFLKTTKKKYLFLIIGSTLWLDENIQKNIQRLELSDTVRLVPSQEHQVLHTYYQGATALLMPSLYEGFGLPAIEAMASGCPVIASNIGGVPEIVRNAGLLANPTDYQQFAKYMKELTTNKHLQENMVQKGLKNAKEFQWRKFAKEILDIIHSL